MNQSTPSRSIPLPLWVTVGFYAFYLVVWLVEWLVYIWTWESKDFVKNLAHLLFWVVLFASTVVGLLTRKPYGRRCAIGVGGVGVPAVGVALLVVWAIHGGQAGDPPAWLVVLVCLVFVLGGIWHWWALTRPAVRQWFASSQAKALPAKGRGHRVVGKKGTALIRLEQMGCC
jgi:hypothetical protein